MLYFFIIIMLFLTDYISKQYIKNRYKLNEKISVYKDYIYIFHIKNEGFAYGILKNFKKLIYIIMSLCMVFICLLFFKSLKEDSKIKKIAFSFALGGALGNFYDRIKNKNITDFIYIKYKNLPIFNLADIYLLLSLILILLESIINKDNKNK